MISLKLSYDNDNSSIDNRNQSKMGIRLYITQNEMTMTITLVCIVYMSTSCCFVCFLLNVHVQLPQNRKPPQSVGCWFSSSLWSSWLLT